MVIELKIKYQEAMIMKILVRRLKAFVGKNLIVELKNFVYEQLYEFNKEGRIFYENTLLLFV